MTPEQLYEELTLNQEFDRFGNKAWRNNKGKFHRLCGPAMETANGSKRWYKNGLRHREDGPAVEHKNGTKEYWINGKRHREDGPAFKLFNGTEYWYQYGLLHRENGPAVIYFGSCGEEYWIYGVRVS